MRKALLGAAMVIALVAGGIAAAQGEDRPARSSGPPAKGPVLERGGASKSFRSAPSVNLPPANVPPAAGPASPFCRADGCPTGEQMRLPSAEGLGDAHTPE